MTSSTIQKTSKQALRNRSFVLVALFLSHFLASELAAESAVDAHRPNVLFIAIDDFKPLLGCYDVPWIQSPAIDKLALRSTVFTSTYCQVPLCAPTRASLLTGLRPDSTRVYFNPFKVKNVLRVRLPNVITLPQHFKNQGYTSCAMGKVFDGRTVDPGHDAVSWSEPFVTKYEAAPQGLGFRGYQDPTTRAYLKQAMKAHPGKHIPGPPFESWDGPDNIYRDGAMARTAVQKIKQFANDHQPFFLAVGFFKPHLPFVAPKKYWDLYDRDQFELAPFQQFPAGQPPYAAVIPNSGELRDYAGVPQTGPIPEEMQQELIHAYAACASYIDAQVALLVDALRETGIEDNTIICLWGDHGWHLGEHGHWGKSSTYEDATRCPLIIHDPNIGHGVRTDSVTELLDVYPTLCELAGIAVPPHVQGKSLVRLMHTPNVVLHEAALSQSSTVDAQMSPQLVAGKLNEFSEIESHMGWSVRTRRYRYTEWRTAILDGNDRTFGTTPVGIELYDYEKDPLEKENLATDSANQEILRQHQHLLDQLVPDLSRQSVNP